MNVLIFAILCLAFIGGTFASALSGWLAWLSTLGLGLLMGLFIPLVWTKGPKRWVWFLMGIIACVACLYTQFRTPAPSDSDISKYVPIDEVVVRGTINEDPRLTASDRARFTMSVQSITIPELEPETTTESTSEDDGQSEIKPQPATQVATGNLYVTISITQATGLRRGQVVTIEGSLYRPSRATNPGQFDFAEYLARQGVFAGLQGRELTLQSEPKFWGGWRLRQRLIRAHVEGLGMPKGALLSALVLGNRATDVPYGWREKFQEVGLAWTLAASGFHVALLLGAVLAVSQHSTPQQKFRRGSLVLLIFLILAGGSPSILRAAIMGMGGLVGLVTERRSRPLVGLGFAAIALLIIQPLWIWDLGFQLSFLATLGLIVTATPLTKKMIWLPPLVANSLAVPIAAFVWILPLQLFVFGRFSIYNIFTNVLVTPFVSVCVVGGLIAGLVGILFVPLGALASWVLLTPISAITAIVNWANNLPNAVTNTGTISLWQMLMAYSLMVLVWLHPWWHKRWLVGVIATLIVVFIPTAVAQNNLFRVILLDAGRVPIMVVNHQGETTLVNAGNNQVAAYTLLPLLEKSGVNTIDWAIATDPQPDVSKGWTNILGSSIAIEKFRDMGGGATSQAYEQLRREMASAGIDVNSLELAQSIEITPQLQVEVVNKSPGVLRIITEQTIWLMLADADPRAQVKLLDRLYYEPDPDLIDPSLPPAAPEPKPNLKADILWWNGGEIVPDMLAEIAPEVAIASTPIIDEYTIAQIQAAQIRLYWTGRDGAIQWTTTSDIQALAEHEDAAFPL
jgi:competence protein ComEC